MAQHGQDPRGQIGPRGIDQPLDSPRPLTSLLNQASHVIGIRSVGDTHFGRASLVAKLLLQLDKSLFTPSGGQHMRSLASKRHRDGSAHATGGTDDDGRLSTKLI